MDILKTFNKMNLDEKKETIKSITVSVLLSGKVAERIKHYYN